MFIITSNYLPVSLSDNLVSIRRTVLLAEFLTIFALEIIFNCGNRHGTSEEKEESKVNLRSHFAPPKSAQIPTNYISKRGKLIQLSFRGKPVGGATKSRLFLRLCPGPSTQHAE